MPSRVLAAGAAAVVLLFAVACSSDESSRDRPGSGTSTGSSASSSPSGSPSGSASGTPGPSSEMTAAGGIQLETMDTLRFRTPTGGSWSQVGSGTRTVTTADYVETGTVTISVGEFPTTSTDIEEVAAADVASLSSEQKAANVARVENRVVNGREGWVLEGADADHLFYTFGSINAGAFVTLNFTLPIDLSAPQDLIDSVLASIEWK